MITALPTTLLSILCSLFRCLCAFFGSIHAFPGSLYAFLCPSSSAPTRWPAWSTGRPLRPTRRSADLPRWPAWSAGGAFNPTRWTFGTTSAWWFFIGRLCRFLVGLRLLDLLLCSALRTEVSGFIGKLLATVRTELGGFLGEFCAALRAEVSSFIENLRATVRARQLFLLFLGMLLGHCALLPCSWWYLSQRVYTHEGGGQGTTPNY